MDTPPDHLAHAAIQLRRWREADADLCLRLVTESLEHLQPWMPWATSGYGLADATDYLRRCETEWAAGSAFNYLILAAGQPAGSAGLMARIDDGGLEIGYWVHPGFTNRGVATSAAAALTEAAFALPGIDHVEIHHDMLNLASRRVPEKLGFAPEGTGPPRFALAPSDSGTTQVWRITR
ncbi:MAG TPA: GNAT family N-acetyltransferase [Streptosporangiaceae bacterium]|nr:GNAT family N-acetyltransferase [Streptosporangiaceae bacterium]